MSEIDIQDHVADYYVEKRYVGDSLEYHKAVIAEMMEGVHGKVLDVGCGTGVLHDLYPNLDIIGIDVSSGMLAYHKGKHKLASAEDIPYAAGRFDSVVCRSVLHHLPSPEKALEEIKRVLKPGGTFVAWETNKGAVAHAVRSVTQHGDHFSEYHAKTGIVDAVRSCFHACNVKYGGVFAYLTAGFPDIVRFPPFLTSNWRALKAFDDKIPQAILKHLGFYVMIKAKK